jgi:TFIIF-interacting CTD phosphatase-like protein
VTSREVFPEGNVNKKNIGRLFPSDDSMVVIVDDKEDIWASEPGQMCVCAFPLFVDLMRVYTDYGSMRHSHDFTTVHWAPVGWAAAGVQA